MGFNSAFKGLKLLKNPGNGRLNNLNNLNDPVLNVLKESGGRTATAQMANVRTSQCAQTDRRHCTIGSKHMQKIQIQIIQIN